MDRRGLCKVTDFGIAQVEDSTSVHTREGASMGTAGFMAPEQRTDASSTDERADVFSAGATLFSLLTGGERTLDLYAVEAEDLVADGLNPAVVAVVLRASRYRRDERYATCTELAAALEEILPTLPPDPLTVPLEIGAPPTAASELTPAPESFTLPDGILPAGASPTASHPTFPPEAPIEPPAPRERVPVVLPYQMPKVEGQRRTSHSDTDALPDYVDAASVKDAPAGFEVGLAEADRLATEHARRAKLEADEKSDGEPTSGFEGEDGAKTVGRFLYEIIASTLSVLIRPLALISVIGSVVGTIALGALWYAAAPLREAEAGARTAQRAYFGALSEECPRIRNDLVELGAPPSPDGRPHRAVRERARPGEPPRDRRPARRVPPRGGRGAQGPDRADPRVQARARGQAPRRARAPLRDAAHAHARLGRGGGRARGADRGAARARVRTGLIFARGFGGAPRPVVVGSPGMDPTPAQGPPELIDGRYKLIKPIGQGGMAAVYLVWDQRLRAWRALKILLAEHARDPALRKRFEAEAQAMARLEHVNVVRVYDVALDGDLPYISMELVEGGSLDLWIKRNGAMPARLATEAILQVCDGIAAAHDEGIVHRDVKPHNILVDRKGMCKVTDFGIARMEDDGNLTLTGTVMGTLGFMAPEQRMDTKLVDARADVYSIGATLFSLLTGRKKVGDLFAAEEHELVDLGIARTVAPILLKATRYKREQRYDTVMELAQALWETLPGLPEHPPGITLVNVDNPANEAVEGDPDGISSPSRPPHSGPHHKGRTATPAPSLIRQLQTRQTPVRPVSSPPASRISPASRAPDASLRYPARPDGQLEALDAAPPRGAPGASLTDPPARSNPTLARSLSVPPLVSRAPVVYEDVGPRSPRGVALVGAGIEDDDIPAPIDVVSSPPASPRRDAPDPHADLVSSAPTTIAPPAPRAVLQGPPDPPVRAPQPAPTPARMAARMAATAGRESPTAPAENELVTADLAPAPPPAAPEAPATEPDAPPDPLRALVQPFVVMSLVVVLLAVAWAAFTAFTAFNGQDARRSEAVVTATQDALFDVVEAEIPRLRSDLSDLGSHTATVEKLYQQFEREPDPAARVRLTSQLVAIVGQELDARSKDAPITASYKIPEARNRLQKLQNARSSYDVAMQKLEAVQGE